LGRCGGAIEPIDYLFAAQGRLKLTASYDSYASAKSMESLIGERPADFRIRQRDRGEWEIFILSATAKNWALQAARHQSASAVGNTIRTDVAGVNKFICRAREKGYHAQYIGPQEVIYI